MECVRDDYANWRKTKQQRRGTEADGEETKKVDKRGRVRDVEGESGGGWDCTLVVDE